MTAIEASFVKSSLLVDGTLRLVCDVEPRHAQAAFALFHAPGASMALAALKTPELSQPNTGAKRERTDAQRAAWDDLGPLAKWAVERCGEPQFQRWLELAARQGSFPHAVWQSAGDKEAQARAGILAICQVKSRKELDTDLGATELLHDYIRNPYGEWLKANPA